MTTVDLARLRELYHSNERAKVLLNVFARRKRQQPETRTDKLVEVAGANGISRSQLIEVFRALEDAGCGRYIEGRKGHPSRFAWSVNLITAARAASGRDESVVELGKEPESPAAARRARLFAAATSLVEDPGASVPEGWLRHNFHLRPELTLQLDLPADLTGPEAKRLARFVGALSFEG